MNKKYILTDETLNFYNHTLHRIKAIKDFNDVKAGNLGGWIEKEENLSHIGLCWVYDEAKVYGEAKVYDNARVYGEALVYDKALVFGETQVSGETQVFGKAQISGKAQIYGEAQVLGTTEVYAHTRLCSTALIQSTKDYITIGPIGSRNDYTTFAKSVNGDILVFCGCFSGSIRDFKKSVKKTHKILNKYRQEYLRAIKIGKTHLNMEARCE